MLIPNVLGISVILGSRGREGSVMVKHFTYLGLGLHHHQNGQSWPMQYLPVSAED